MERRGARQEIVALLLSLFLSSCGIKGIPRPEAEPPPPVDAGCCR